MARVYEYKTRQEHLRIETVFGTGELFIAASDAGYLPASEVDALIAALSAASETKPIEKMQERINRLERLLDALKTAMPDVLTLEADRDFRDALEAIEQFDFDEVD